MRVLVCLVSLLAVAGCDPAGAFLPVPGEPADGVSLVPEALAVDRGETLGFELVNESPQAIEMGVLCTGTIERWDGGAWRVRRADNDRVCILPLIIVESGGRYEDAMAFDVARGTVRVVHSVAVRGGASLRVASPSIHVR